MKRTDLVKLLEKNGWWIRREGGNHTIFTDGINIEPISHTREIPEPVAKKIIKRRGLK
ncbi:MAG: type II toxin-antitoxin system HicA family toxin [Oscillospiraceae bacterium]|jgi:predicted RNA binding protein YcfA (HicA-like mRNA interferase family)|nr:type II toxin-antitoxin system HicA family toxin [Oscillospiraceae bacterium]